jgi:hypothetical protein
VLGIPFTALAVAFAGYQLETARAIEANRVAVEALQLTTCADFRRPYARLCALSHSASEGQTLSTALHGLYRQTSDVDDLRLAQNDLDIVLGTYSYVWVLCTKGIVDKEMIEPSLCLHVRPFKKVLDVLEEWDEHLSAGTARGDFDKLHARLVGWENRRTEWPRERRVRYVDTVQKEDRSK